MVTYFMFYRPRQTKEMFVPLKALDENVVGNDEMHDSGRGGGGDGHVAYYTVVLLSFHARRWKNTYPEGNFWRLM